MRLPSTHHCVRSMFAVLIGVGGFLTTGQAQAQTCTLPPVPVRPNPANGTSNIGTDPVLQWNGNCVELMTNGDFEAGLTGWTTTATGGGAFVLNTVNVMAVCSGAQSAASNPTMAGKQTIFRDVTIPTGPSATITLKWDHQILNQAAFFTDPTQEYRVEIRNTSDTLLATAYSTNPGDTLLEGSCTTHTFDLTPFIGQVVRIAFVVQSEIAFMNVQVDNVSVKVCDGSPGGVMAAASVAATDPRKLGVGDTWQGNPYRTVVVGPEANVSEGTEAQVYVGQTNGSPLMTTLVNTCSPVAFPSGFSTINASVGVLPVQPPQIGYFFNNTHFVEQTFTLPAASYDRFVFDFFVPINMLAPGSTVEWDVSVTGLNGTKVILGSFSVVPSQTGPVHLEFTKEVSGTPSGGGFDYVIRWEVTNNAVTGSHSLGIADPVAGSVQISKVKYDLLLDTVNPPQKMVAANLDALIFDVPAILSPGKTYYWQVISKDCCGDVPSPVWSFVTTCPGTPAPTNPFPVDAQNAVAVSPTLTWTVNASAPALYGAATDTNSVDDPSGLYRVVPQTAATVRIGSIGFNGVTGLAFSPVNKKLYGTCNDPSDSSQALLIEIDPLTGVGTSIGRVDTGGNGQRRVCDLSFGGDGKLYGYGENPHQLITLNLATGAGTLVGLTGFVGVGNGMAFGSDGILYATPGNIVDDCLVTLEPATGAGTCIPGSAGNVSFFINAMDYSFSGGKMFGVWNADPGTGDTRLRTISLANGQDAAVGSFSVNGVDALAFLNANAYDVFLDTTNPPTTLVGNDVPVPFFDVEAQMGPLTPSTTYYWKVIGTDPCGTTEGPVWSFTTCALPNTPSNPVPLNAAQAQGIDLTLTWSGGGECSPTYDVYFDTVNPPGVLLCPDAASAQCQTGTLATGTEYFWKVVAKSPGGTVEGPIWSLTTDTPPTVSSETPPRDTNVTSLTSIQVTFSKSVAGVVAGDLTINGAGASSVGGSGAGPYTFNFSQPAEGNVNIALGAGAIAASPSGVSFAGDSWTYNLDSIAPAIDSETPARGASLMTLTSISITFTEPVTGVVAGDLLRNGSGANGFTGSGAGPYVFTFTSEPPAGMVTVALGTGNIQDDHGNAFAGEGWSYEMDLTPPTVSNVSPTRDTTINDLTSISVTFDESVTGVAAGDLTVSGTTVSGVTGSGAGPYAFTFVQPADGTISVTLGAGSIQDDAGNPFAGDNWTYTLEPSAMVTYPADVDGDGDVDGVDFAAFASCFNKSGNPPRTVGCPPAQAAALDFDNDNDVDGVDFATFASCFNKSGNPPRTLGCPTN